MRTPVEEVFNKKRKFFSIGKRDRLSSATRLQRTLKKTFSSQNACC